MTHLAVIADGNRRWAKERALPLDAGHMQGLITIERICDWAINNYIPYLTVYCFSTENWNRPKEQVDSLMDIALNYFSEQIGWYINKGINVHFVGRRDRLPQELLNCMPVVEEETAKGRRLSAFFCVDYGGRDEIVRAISSGACTEDTLSHALNYGAPDPDMILRTGGHMRLSNFLLWQSAYSELYFTDTLFPDLSITELDKVLAEYKCRKRNYGK